MDRDTSRRGAASASSSGARPRGDVRPAAPSRAARQRPAPPGAPGAARPRPAHRITAAERMRQRRRRALLGFLLVVLALALGAYFSAKLLFKVREFRLESFDGDAPADTGIYTEAQILETLGVQAGDDLFGFSARAKTALLAEQLPYLERVQVGITMPGTVVVKVQPAVERFAVALPNGWLVLSDSLKVLRNGDTCPEGAIVLEAGLPEGAAPAVGQTLELETYNSLLEVADLAGGEAATQSTETADAVLGQFMELLGREGLLPGVTALSVADLSELTFTYQGRVLVRLGTANRLADKLHMAANALLTDHEESLGASDRGVLEFYQYSGSELRAAFRPGDPAAAEDPVLDDPGLPAEGGDGAVDPGEDEPPVG